MEVKYFKIRKINEKSAVNENENCNYDFSDLKAF